MNAKYDRGTHLLQVSWWLTPKVHGQIASERIVGFEERAKGVAAQIVQKDEPPLPNAIYIGVVSIAGLILARERGFVSRFATVSALGLGTFYLLMPNTFHRLGRKLHGRISDAKPMEKLQEYSPQTVQAIQVTRDHANVGIGRLQSWKEIAENKLESTIKSIRYRIIDLPEKLRNDMNKV